MLSEEIIFKIWNNHPDALTGDEGVVALSRDIEATVLPEGWVAVPKEPTEKILEWLDPGFGTRREAYAAMLAAAPKAQADPCHKKRNQPCQCSRKAMLCDGFGPDAAQAEKQEPVNDEPVAWCVAYDDPRMGRIHSNPSMHKPELEALIGRAGNQLVLVPLYTRPQPENPLWQATAKSLGAEVDNLTAGVERLRQICRDAYEVWAGSDGIPEPITCVEAYLLQLLIAMRDEVKRGLK